MSSRSNRRRSFSPSPSRSSRSSKHYPNNKHDRDSRYSSRNNYHSNNDRTNRNNRNSNSRYSRYSRSRSRSRSQSRSLSSSHSDHTSKKNYRENAELPSDHPLFSIVKENKQLSPKPKPHSYHKHSHNNENYQRGGDRNRYHRDWNHGHGHGHRDRDRERDRERDRGRDIIEDSGRGHSYHTGHKQQILNRRKEKEIIAEISTEQAQQIIAVTAVVQKQEEISSIVETQKRKLAQKTSLEKIKEKILLQKQQMMSQKQQQQQQQLPNNTQTMTNNENGINNIFEAEVVIANDKPNGNNKGIIQRQAIENLAVFVSNHGIALEQTVRDRSKHDPKFSWLYDEESNGYKYYQYLLKKKKKENCKDNSDMDENNNEIVKKQRKRRRFSAHPADNTKDERKDVKSLDKMKEYITKLENKEKEKKDLRFERSNQMSIFNGGSSHHIGDYLPKNELNKFNNKYKAYQPLTYANKGHEMLKKLGWNEGKGLGKNEQGETKPISDSIKHQQIYGHKPWDPTPGDTQYDLYKKKMMLSYRYRPNPLGNPRKDYY